MRNPERAGLLFALAGFSMLPVGDAIIKSTGGIWPGTAVALVRFIVGAAGLAVLLLLREGRQAFRPPRPAIQLVRGLGMAIATLGFFSALFLMPFAEVTALSFTSPMLTGLLAGPVLGEKPRPATWLASFAAFAGVLIILRPNFAEIGWAALLPVVSAAAFSAVILANRAVAGSASALAMQAYLAMGAVPFVAVAAIAGHWSGYEALEIDWPGWGVIGACAIVALTASIAHWLIFQGTTRANVSAIAPMAYVQMLFAVGFGLVFFGERPDTIALLGAGLIVAAGLFLWRAGRQGQGQGPGR